jgi:cytoskeletal protein CcmA (bactofilin family)
VTILPKGDVTTRIVCGSGRIEGKMRGSMVCTGTLELDLEGKLVGQIEAHKLVVEKKSNVEVQRPVKAGQIEINGTLVTPEVRCEEVVTVNKRGVLRGAVYAPKVAVEKGGVLEGAVYARSVAVEQGGILSGELHIGPPEPEPVAVEPEPAPVEPPKEEPLPPKGPVPPHQSVLRKARRVGTSGRKAR